MDKNKNIMNLYKDIASGKKHVFLGIVAKDLDLKFNTVNTWFKSKRVSEKNQDRVLTLVQNWHKQNYENVKRENYEIKETTP